MDDANHKRRIHASRAALAMTAAVGILILAAWLNYEGCFGPVACWPRDYDPQRAERILDRVEVLRAYEAFRTLCREADEKAIRVRVTQRQIWRTRVQSTSGETLTFNLVEPRVHDCIALEINPELAWRAWLAGELASERPRVQVPLRVAPKAKGMVRLFFSQGGRLLVRRRVDCTYALLEKQEGVWKFDGFHDNVQVVW